MNGKKDTTTTTTIPTTSVASSIRQPERILKLTDGADTKEAKSTATSLTALSNNTAGSAGSPNIEKSIRSRKVSSKEVPPICFRAMCEELEGLVEDGNSEVVERVQEHMNFVENLPYVRKPTGGGVRSTGGRIVSLRARTPTGEQDQNEALQKRLGLLAEDFILLKENYVRVMEKGWVAQESIERFYYAEREAMFRFLFMAFHQHAASKEFFDGGWVSSVAGKALASLSEYTLEEQDSRLSEDSINSTTVSSSSSSFGRSSYNRRWGSNSSSSSSNNNNNNEEEDDYYGDDCYGNNNNNNNNNNNRWHSYGGVTEDDGNGERRDKLHVAECLSITLFLAALIGGVEVSDIAVLEILRRTMLGTALVPSAKGENEAEMPTFAKALIFTYLISPTGPMPGRSTNSTQTLFRTLWLTNSLIEVGANKVRPFTTASAEYFGFVALEESLRGLSHAADQHTYAFFQNAAYAYISRELAAEAGATPAKGKLSLTAPVRHHFTELLHLCFARNSKICAHFCNEAGKLHALWGPDVEPEALFDFLAALAREADIITPSDRFEKIVPLPQLRQSLFTVLETGSGPAFGAGVHFVESLFAGGAGCSAVVRKFFGGRWDRLFSFVARAFRYVVARNSDPGAGAAAFGLMQHILRVDESPFAEFLLENRSVWTEGTASKYALALLEVGSADACHALRRFLDFQTAFVNSALVELVGEKDVEGRTGLAAAYTAIFANVIAIARRITDNERLPCSPLQAFSLIKSVLKFLNAVALSNTHRGKSILIKEFTAFCLRGQSLAKIITFTMHPREQQEVITHTHTHIHIYLFF